MFFFFKQKTAYEIKECDWSSDVCSSDLLNTPVLVSGERAPEIDPQLAEELKTGLFDDEKVAEVFKKGVEAFSQGNNAQTNAAQVQLERRLMRVEPETAETFKMFESEIDKRVRTKYAEHAPTPGIYEFV